MAPTNRFLCPINGCDWHHDEAPFEPQLPDADDFQLLVAQQMEEVEGILRGHFEIHSVQEWAQTVSNLRTELAQRGQPLMCLACVVANHNAQREGLDVGPVNAAVVIANGSGICLGHLKISDKPTLNGRTAGGIVLPGGPIGQG